MVDLSRPNSSSPLPTFPPLAALFLTHFDDVKGQSIIYYASTSAETIPSLSIEHVTLPSGLHLIENDLICFTHCNLPGVGLFRSRESGQGRGKRMATVGVVLASSSIETLFELRQPLSTLYDHLESLSSSPFGPESLSVTTTYLSSIWTTSMATLSPSSSSKLTSEPTRTPAPAPSSGRTLPRPLSSYSTHPLTYLPSLFTYLGPSIINIYKASLSGQRILLYSNPPLLPLAAFSWCIWAMGKAPVGVQGGKESMWLGNIGLMDLDRVRKMKGSWIATTSDAIYRSHPATYDLFVDLSSSLHTFDEANQSPRSNSASHVILTATVPPTTPCSKPTTINISYSFADLPLYRSLVMLDRSPKSVNVANAKSVGSGATRECGTVGVSLSETAGVWLLFFALAERFWSLCVGVCEFAVGRGRVGEIALGEGDEDARQLLLDDQGMPIVDIQEEGEQEESEENEDEHVSNFEQEDDDALRRGKLILRQFHHNSYHLYWRLLNARRSSGTSDTRSRAGGLTDKEIQQLCGMKRSLGAGADEARFWRRLANTWGLVDIEQDLD